MDLNPAIASLLGAIIGGLIAASSNLLLTYLKERSDRRREARSLARDMTTAARLVQQEFMFASATVRAVRNAKEWLPNFHEVSSAAWDKHAATLAAGLPHPDWLTLDLGVTALKNCKIFASYRGMKLSEDEIKTLDTTIETLDNARKVLGEFTHDPEFVKALKDALDKNVDVNSPAFLAALRSGSAEAINRLSK